MNFPRTEKNVSAILHSVFLKLSVFFMILFWACFPRIRATLPYDKPCTATRFREVHCMTVESPFVKKEANVLRTRVPAIEKYQAFCSRNDQKSRYLFEMEPKLDLGKAYFYLSLQKKLEQDQSFLKFQKSLKQEKEKKFLPNSVSLLEQSETKKAPCWQVAKSSLSLGGQILVHDDLQWTPFPVIDTKTELDSIQQNLTELANFSITEQNNEQIADFYNTLGRYFLKNINDQCIVYKQTNQYRKFEFINFFTNTDPKLSGLCGIKRNKKVENFDRNEFARICHQSGLDVVKYQEIINSFRVGAEILARYQRQINIFTDFPTKVENLLDKTRGSVNVDATDLPVNKRVPKIKSHLGTVQFYSKQIPQFGLQACFGVEFPNSTISVGLGKSAFYPFGNGRFGPYGIIAGSEVGCSFHCSPGAGVSHPNYKGLHTKIFLGLGTIFD